MEGWRPGATRQEKDLVRQTKRTLLPPTGLPMEGNFPHNQIAGIDAMLRQLINSPTRSDLIVLPMPIRMAVRTVENMKRVVILGRGASGKSTLARRLGEITGLPVIELDKVFWQPGLLATPRDQWVAQQEKLTAEDGWIMDGDLGDYDAVEVRLRAADTVILLDFSLVRCAWRAVWRSRERAKFWRWLLAYRFQSRPILIQAIADHAPSAELRILRNPEALRKFVAEAGRGSPS
jgi:nicotinamide riboside kinase